MYSRKSKLPETQLFWAAWAVWVLLLCPLRHPPHRCLPSPSRPHRAFPGPPQQPRFYFFTPPKRRRRGTSAYESAPASLLLPGLGGWGHGQCPAAGPGTRCRQLPARTSRSAQEHRACAQFRKHSWRQKKKYTIITVFCFPTGPGTRIPPPTAAMS